MSAGVSSGQLVEQRLSLLQIERVEAFGEPAVDRSEKIAGLIPLALIAPEPRHAHRRAQFPGLRLLLTRNRERALEVRFRFRRIRLAATSARFRRLCDGPRPRTTFLGCFHRRHRFANAAPSVIELAEFRMGRRQI